MTGRLLVVAGPSGVGKSTVVNWVRSNAPSVWVSVSMTTRPMRSGESHGVEYFFVERSEFESTVSSGDMLEWAEYAGNLYGTPAAPVADRLAAGQSVILEIEIQGAAQVKERFPEAILVFLKPPSWEVLVQRLTGRGTETEESIAKRLKVAEIELAAESQFDQSVVCDTVEGAGSALLDLTA